MTRALYRVGHLNARRKPTSATTVVSAFSLVTGSTVKSARAAHDPTRHHWPNGSTGETSEQRDLRRLSVFRVVPSEDHCPSRGGHFCHWPCTDFLFGKETELELGKGMADRFVGTQATEDGT